MRYGFGTDGYGMMSGPGGFFMGLFMLLLLALMILGIMALLRYLHNSKTPLTHSDDTALHVLSDRFARGEINNDEYAAKKALLTKR